MVIWISTKSGTCICSSFVWHLPFHRNSKVINVLPSSTQNNHEENKIIGQFNKVENMQNKEVLENWNEETTQESQNNKLYL